MFGKFLNFPKSKCLTGRQIFHTFFVKFSFFLLYHFCSEIGNVRGFFCCERCGVPASPRISQMRSPSIGFLDFRQIFRLSLLVKKLGINRLSRKTIPWSIIRIFCPKYLMTFCRRIRKILTELFSGRDGRIGVPFMLKNWMSIYL